MESEEALHCAMKKAMKKVTDNQQSDKGNKVPRPPTPLALIPCFQVPPTLTPRPWAGRKGRVVEEEEEVAQWDPLAGSRHDTSNTTRPPPRSLRDA